MGYVVDGENSNYSVKNIVMFLKDVQQKTGAEKIHLIAHSMGNRALTDALMLLHQEEFHKTFLFNQIILAAPDIDAQLFLRDIAPKIINCSGRVTIYASSKDKALKVSKKLHGNLNRVGQITDQILTIKGIDTIDASKVRTDLLGHGYFSSTAPLIQDIFHLTKNNLSPQERNLKKIQTDNGLYWAFND
ncbi:alpha/beta hydrolase [Pedobacter sp. B4-66]|uniref:alpha/beta hydrolase n=1 Tax=Pedobacter sp. B4-66 TaxID=2817280 RepID=UPI001BDACC9C|nr:alpha/beta hydrolase [Pedobacter sp. B4-66]